MKHTIAIIGAGGKMGRRTAKNLRDHPDFELLCVEVSENGRAQLEDDGYRVMDKSEVERLADVMVLALPDNVIGPVTQSLVPNLQSGTLVIGLDPAAAYAGVLPDRDDITYFITHPCHPVLFNEKTQAELDQPDWFGGNVSPQSIVCALHKGDENLYALGEQVAREMFRPILRVHRITTEQMAILEPATVETTTASLILACKQALDKCVEMGVPEEAAWDFVMGHIRIELAILFGYADFPFSDGAKKAVELAQEQIFKEGWMDTIFSKKAIQQSVKKITASA